MWGKRANLIVSLSKISKRELAALIGEAWQNVSAPRKERGAIKTKSGRSAKKKAPKRKC